MVKEAGDPNDTRARHGILVQSTGLHSLRQTQCFAPAFASRLHNHGCHNHGGLFRGRGARIPNLAWSNGSDDPNDTRACRLHNRP